MSQCSTPIHQGQHVDLTSHHMLPFRTVDHLGMGMSATVNEVEDGTNGMRFAHKIYRPCYGLAHERLKQAFKDEINIIKRLHSHPHIIELYWSYTREKTFGILLTPVASNGDLNAYLQIIQATQNTLTSQQFSVLSRSFGCLASGLAFIHSRTIRHKDIKPQNILVHNGKMIYTDFGIALDGSEQDTTTTGRPDAFTKRYCAPEVANSEPRNRKSDVFSLGCVFLEIMALLAPGFNGGTSDDTLPYWQRVIAIQNNLIHLGNSSTSSGQVLLICKAMLESRSEDRVGADAVLYQVRSLRGSCLEPTYELLCEDCEGFPTNVAQTAMNKGAVAISDRRSDVCSQGKTDNCQEEDGKFQVETPIVPSVLAIDPQASKDARDEVTQEHCNLESGFDIDTSSSSPNHVSLRFQHEHKSTEAKEGDTKPLQTRKLPETLQKVMEHIFPLEIHSRLRDNKYQCVASLVSTPSKRCMIRRPSAPDWIFRKLSGCNTDVTYSGLLNNIRSLVQAVMCDSHQNVVLSSPSIVKIQELVPNQSHLSNGECSYLRMWIVQSRSASNQDESEEGASESESISPSNSQESESDANHGESEESGSGSDSASDVEDDAYSALTDLRNVSENDVGWVIGLGSLNGHQLAQAPYLRMLFLSRTSNKQMSMIRTVLAAGAMTGHRFRRFGELHSFNDLLEEPNTPFVGSCVNKEGFKRSQVDSGMVRWQYFRKILALRSQSACTTVLCSSSFDFTEDEWATLEDSAKHATEAYHSPTQVKRLLGRKFAAM